MSTPALPAAAPRPPVPTVSAPGVSKTTVTSPPSGANALAAELARHPEISAEMRNRILADAPPTTVSSGTPAAPGTPTRSESASNAAAQNAARTANASLASTRETAAALDTTQFPDGTYLVRVRATDKPSNPDGALTTEKVSGEFRLVNRAPLLALFNRETLVKDKTVQVSGVASHPLAGIRAVQYRVDGGDWMAARADDGIFDSTTEAFMLTTAPLSSGSHTVEVQAQDEAGNTATEKTTVLVP